MVFGDKRGSESWFLVIREDESQGFFGDKGG